MSKVSVVIPTYSRASFLPRTIRSVLNQTFKDFELIIIDDGSTDNTKDIIKLWEQKDKRIKGIFLEKNSGAPAHPKNVGILNSKGEYIAFLDSDDEWLPAKLEKQVELFEQSNDSKLGFVGCNALLINTESNIVKEYITPVHKDTFPALLFGNFIWSCSSVIVKKDVFENIGLFDENLKFSGDWDMWIRIAQEYNFNFVPEPLFKYYVHGGNITQTLGAGKKIEDLQYLLKKYMKYYKTQPKSYSNMIRALGMFYINAKQNVRGKKYFLRAIEMNPLSIKNYICLFIHGSRLYEMLRYIKSKVKDKFQI